MSCFRNSVEQGWAKYSLRAKSSQSRILSSMQWVPDPTWLRFLVQLNFSFLMFLSCTVNAGLERHSSQTPLPGSPGGSLPVLLPVSPRPICPTPIVGSGAAGSSWRPAVDHHRQAMLIWVDGMGVVSESGVGGRGWSQDHGAVTAWGHVGSGL